MPETIGLEQLAQLLIGREGRTIVAIAGAPASGKSTFAEALQKRIIRDGTTSCEVFPMDGFHYDDTYLTPMGWQSRKGAPHTFDVGGIRTTLSRLKANTEAQVCVPIFDREIEIARAGARMIGQDVDVIIVEGNYLLLNAAPWTILHDVFDLTVMLNVPIEITKLRLEKRWADLGFSKSEADIKIQSNDLLNAETVLNHSIPAEYRVDNDG